MLPPDPGRAVGARPGATAAGGDAGRRPCGGANVVRRIPMLAAWFIACCAAVPSHAGLSIVGTRFIYAADAKRVTVGVQNKGDRPVLVQTWLDDGDAGADPSRLAVPFVIVPPLFRLDPQQKQSIRVQYLGGGLASDRESLFWINVLEVPPADSDGADTLRVSYRMRMKLLYRPQGLDGAAADAPARLRWAVTRGAGGDVSLVATNPTPYYVALTGIRMHGARASFEHGAADVAPFGRVAFPVPDASAVSASDEVMYDAVRDDGVSTAHRARVDSP
jgi:chaperone protein EcpD